MKILSILLRLVAIAGAAFCVYAWVDTKGKTTESMEHMKEIAGETLQMRTAQVPDILKEKRQTEATLRKTEDTLKATKDTLANTENDLKDERDRVVQAQEEILDKNTQIKSLNTKVSGLEASVASAKTEVDDLKNEIVKIKSETEPLIASLNSQIQTLEAEIAHKDVEKAEAVAGVEKELNAKMENMVMASTGEVVEEVPVYVAEGEIVTILKASEGNDLFVVNKGAASGFKQNQKFKIKDEGNFIAEFTVTILQGNSAVCSVADKNIGIPETIFVGDTYEVVIEAPEAVAEASEEAATDAI